MGRSSDAKRRLIESAKELIYARSYAGVGVQEICDKADVKKGSFYHFFPSKRQLALAVLDHHWETFQKELLAPAFVADVPPLERIKRLFKLGFAAQRSLQEATGHAGGCPIGGLAAELSSQDDLLRQRLQDVFQQWAAYFERAIREAVDAGDLPPETDPAGGAEAILAYLEGVSLMVKTRNEPRLMERLAQGAVLLAAAPAGA